MKPDYVDILLLTALYEERFLLDKVLVSALREHYKGHIDYIPEVKILLEYDGHRAATQKDAGFVSIKIAEQEFLRIAWTNLRGPGNVWAYDETSQLIELLSPRFILLIGFAGGNGLSFKRGDVGYGSVIANSSYGKVQSETIADRIARLQGPAIDQSKILLVETLCKQLADIGIDAKKTVFTDIIIRSSERLDTAACFCEAAEAQCSKPDEWRALATQWYGQFKDVYHNEKFALDKKTRTRYPQQEPFERNAPEISPAVVASGDSVVASRDLQATLGALVTWENERLKQDETANMYEMESYGVGLCCKRRNTDFGMVKGISDHAGPDKGTDSGEKDAYRLAALASATAVACCILCDGNFIAGLRRHGERYCWSHSACVWSKSEAPFKCFERFERHDQHELFLCDRPCNRRGSLGFTGERPGSKLFERVSSKRYSECVASIVKKKKFAQIILAFPYSVDDLFSFFYSMPDPEARAAVDRMRPLAKRRVRRASARNPLVKEILQFGPTAYGGHPHFGETNRFCADMIKRRSEFGQIANRICRVMCIYAKDFEDISTNPAFLLHVFMGGICVPTLFADQSILDTYGADEASYVSRRVNSPLKRRPIVTECLKFSDRGKMLAIIGSCNAVPYGTEQSLVHNFADKVRVSLKQIKEPKDIAELSGEFSIFPALRLLERFGLDWSRYDSLVPGYKSMTPTQRRRVREYFAGLAEFERPLD